MNNRLLISSLIFLSASTSAATMPTGFYAKLGIGQSYGKNDDFNIAATSSSTLNAKDSLDFKHSDSYQLAIGYRYPELSWLTTELSLNYNAKLKAQGDTFIINGTSYSEQSHQHIKSTTLMLSGQIDLASYFNQDDWLFHPYVGLGVGVSRNKLSDLSANEDNVSAGVVSLDNADTHTDFAWQTKLGVTYAATKHIVLDLSYAYNDYGKVKAKSTTSGSTTYSSYEMNYRTQQIMLGMRYFF